MKKPGLFRIYTMILFAIFATTAIADDDDDYRNAVFVHGIVLDVDGDKYYFGGAPDGTDGAVDIPGHSWVQTDDDEVIGKHYNTGPFGAPNFWSSDAGDGALLYVVNGEIDTWSMVKAAEYFAEGYIHYHHMVSVADGSLHPTKVVWLRHVAPMSFTQDGGPHPELAHSVSPGTDFNFIQNWKMPYSSAGHM